MIGIDTLRRVLIAVIGTTTAEAVNEVGLEVNIVAKQQTAESLIQGIVEHFGNL
jgi:uroporphyrinogen-III synthase